MQLKDLTPAREPRHARDRVPIADHPGLYLRGSSLVVRTPNADGGESFPAYKTEAGALKAWHTVKSGEPVIAPVRTRFDRYALDWVESYRGRTRRGCSPKHRAFCRWVIETYAIPYFKRTPLEKIDSRKINGFISGLEKRGLSPATTRRYYSVVSAMFNEAVESRHMRDEQLPRRIIITNERGPRKPKVLSVEQAKALLAAIPERYRLVFEFILACGLRISEGCKATWGDLQREDDDRWSYIVDTTKSDAGEGRVIPLAPELSRRLTALKLESPFSRDTDPIFVTRTGTRLSTANVRNRGFNVARDAAGLPWATPHTLRHTFATWITKREGVEVASKLLGHSNSRFTQAVYVHAYLPVDMSFMDDVLGG
jgi:integrase